MQIDNSSGSCKFDGCGDPVKARGWCAKHYRRWLRTGDPGTCRKPGPERSVARQAMDMAHMGREWSPRTVARYQAALNLLRESGVDARPVSTPCVRPNGTINVSAFERRARAAVAAVVLAAVDQ
jgi:hypothetical protein